MYYLTGSDCIWTIKGCYKSMIWVQNFSNCTKKEVGGCDRTKWLLNWITIKTEKQSSNMVVFFGWTGRSNLFHNNEGFQNPGSHGTVEKRVPIEKFYKLRFVHASKYFT